MAGSVSVCGTVGPGAWLVSGSTWLLSVCEPVGLLCCSHTEQLLTEAFNVSLSLSLSAPTPFSLSVSWRAVSLTQCTDVVTLLSH